MGHAIDFTIYWSKEDLIVFRQNTINRMVISELKKINSKIEIVIKGHACKTDYAEQLYQLVFSLSHFIQSYYAEIKFAKGLQIQILLLLAKIKQSSSLGYTETVKVVEAISNYIQRFLPKEIPFQKIRDLLVFETYHFLGLIPQLGSQDKLSVSKVKDVELYSFLLSRYKKPKIQQEYLERFFEVNRKELLIDLVNTHKKISHIHYDAEFLENFMTHKIILELTGQDANIHLNRLVQHEFIR